MRNMERDTAERRPLMRVQNGRWRTDRTERRDGRDTAATADPTSVNHHNRDVENAGLENWRKAFEAYCKTARFEAFENVLLL